MKGCLGGSGGGDEDIRLVVKISHWVYPIRPFAGDSEPPSVFGAKQSK